MPVTIHIPIADVPAALSTEKILTVAHVARDLAGRFGVARPRLAIMGLNPHAGEGGAIGLEDAETLSCRRSRRCGMKGIIAFGPCHVDTMFHPRARKTYDAAICMYHDQALIPAKMLGFDDAVNVTLGLPFVRTSPDHGTAFDIAGTGKARPDSLVAALKLAARPCRQRGGARDAGRTAAACRAGTSSGTGSRPRNRSDRTFCSTSTLTGKVARATGDLTGATVIEVGPGPGGLTRAHFSCRARVVSSQSSATNAACPPWPKSQPPIPDAWNRIRRCSRRRFLALLGNTGDVRIAANLPYNVGTELLVRWVAAPAAPFWTSMTLMFQREVAERIVAGPDDDAYGRLGVLCSWRTHAKITFDIPPQAFWPPPRSPQSRRAFHAARRPLEAELKRLERVTAAAFGQRREMLRQSLKGLGGEALLAAADIDGTRRAGDPVGGRIRPACE